MEQRKRAREIDPEDDQYSDKKPHHKEIPASRTPITDANSLVTPLPTNRVKCPHPLENTAILSLPAELQEKPLKPTHGR
ncbi:hypothetical protein E2P81_ATG11033 [Venturia nashicola]|uniref:Uncharacterized protein n=1 Tax=Venturia nashicola TaxID=86259 RepID=A0A4Z1P2J1_9PEZI|nr:hypothetical protein E6O75_ATG10709 [Venturia nashicola]TLD27745.1 hypothetical protein E2P81_ATG11033 [Venturia nashicola]